MIDWQNDKDKISQYFTVHEAIWLPQWGRLATEKDGLTDEIKNNLVDLFQKMDQAREFFNTSIIVHVSYRPEEYNKLIGGAPMSAHRFGKACDFHVTGIDCFDARKQILDANKLEEWDMRMEDNAPGNWIHLGNDWQEGKSRFFKP